MKEKIFCGISCNLDSNILATALPLFEEGAVEAIEWSFDALFRHSHIPAWFEELLQVFANEGRLIGHGVYYSLFSGKWLPEQQQWLTHLKNTADQYQFDHITEHFGYMTGEDFHKGAPLSVPYNDVTLNIAKDRISRMYEACQCPVGLENLAFSYCLEEVEKHGTFLKAILSEINGFIILDLHNVYCQVKNFSVDFEDILAYYPLEMVREIHISGGSWEDSNVDIGRKIRRDTHDDAVPEAVFDYLKSVIPRIPNLKFVILEQLGTDLKTTESRVQFQKDFKRMKQICKNISNKQSIPTNTFLPRNTFSQHTPYESETLYKEQTILTEILEQSNDFQEVKGRLHASILKDSDWKIEQWQDAMLETAYAISQKWKHGF